MFRTRFTLQDTERGRKLHAASLGGDLLGVRAFIDGAHLFNVTLLLGTLIGNALPLAKYLVD